MGIGRPEKKEEVGDYVLAKFSESSDQIEEMIQRAVEVIESIS